MKQSGLELITRFTSPVFSNTTYTDNNGLRFWERNFQPDLFEPVAGNYYPVVYGSYSKDKTILFGFIYDRAHGLYSSYGNVEVMLHRRLSHDDGRGGEALDDATVIHPVMRVVFGSPKETMRLQRSCALPSKPTSQAPRSLLESYSPPLYQASRRRTEAISSLQVTF